MTEPSASEVLGNRAVEKAAIAFVLDYEQRSGRVARDTRGRGAAGDVESDGRTIEVEAAGGSARGADLWLELRQVEEARRNPQFHLYVVDNVRQGDPQQFGLIDLHGEQLAALLQRAKEQRYYTVPFPVNVYDQGRHVLGDSTPSDEPSGTPDTEQSLDSDLCQMSRTSAIVHVLARHDGPMRPIEVWAQFRQSGRESDPKGDVSTTMFDLWKAGRSLLLPSTQTGRISDAFSLGWTRQPRTELRTWHHRVPVWRRIDAALRGLNSLPTD